MSPKHPANNAENYSSEDFWNKVSKYAKQIGEPILENALKLYYAAEDKNTPLWAKTTIYGALAYLVSPIDAIPDIAPIVGCTDDAAVLIAAVAATAANIKEVHIEKAKEKLRTWFG